MKIDFEGRVWDFDPHDISVKQGTAIAGHTGLSPHAWYKSLTDTDSLGWLKSMQCLYWLMREQAGESIPLKTAEFATLKLFLAFSAAIEAEIPDEAAEEDPTRPGAGPGAEEPDRHPASPSG